MRGFRKFALGASLLASLAIAGTAGGGAIVVAQDQPTVRIGSQDFYEAKLMAEIYAQALEAAGFTVDRLGGLGTRFDLAPTFEDGQVDLVAEYVGSWLGYYTIGAENADVASMEVTGDGETNQQNLQSVFGLLDIEATVLAITPGEDTNAFVVRQDTADALGLSKMSDLAAVQDQVVFGLPSECDLNPLCKGALEQYGIDFDAIQREPLDACGTLIADSLAGNFIDVAELCSTQPAIAQNGFVVLDDDLNTQPADNLVPVVRNDFLAQVDGGADAIAAILDPVSAEITTEILTDLGVRVAVDQVDIEDVASEFLASLSGE